MKSMTKKFESAFAEWVYGNKRLKQDEFGVSELVCCLAKPVLARMHNLEPKVNGKMLSGTLLHSVLPKIFDIAKIEADFEVRCSHNLRDFSIVGLADAVLKNAVIEFKFSKLTQKTPLNYLLQANAYAVMLKKPNYYVAVIDRDNLNVQWSKFKASKFGFEVIVSNAFIVNSALKENAVPKGPVYVWECAFCSFREKCPNCSKMEVKK